MKYIVLSLFILLCFSCENSVREKENVSSNLKTQTSWEVNHLLGRVQSWRTETFDVSDYKFGEPVYVTKSQGSYLFNPFGFMKSGKLTFTSEHYNSYFEDHMTFVNEELGMLKTRTYKSTYDEDSNEFLQEFEYDSLNRVEKKLHRDITTGIENIRIWDYENKQERISEYDENMNLLEVQIKKYDSNQNVVSDVIYDKEGKLKRGVFNFFNRGDLVKDSIVSQYSSRKYIIVSQYDRIGRLEYVENYRIEDNGSVVDKEGSIFEFDSDTFNSSYSIKEFKGDKSIILQRYRVEIKTDIVGNVIEKTKSNSDTNRVVEKEILTYDYY